MMDHKLTFIEHKMYHVYHGKDNLGELRHDYDNNVWYFVSADGSKKYIIDNVRDIVVKLDELNNPEEIIMTDEQH